MKEYTIPQLEEIVNRVMGSQGTSWTTFSVRIVKQTDTELLFEATHMYDWDGYTPSVKQLIAFTKEFGTENIDKYDDISSQGCETCDYGSSYGFALRIWE